MRSWKVRLPLYAAGLATGGAFGVLFTAGALPLLLGAALVALVVGSSGAYRFALLFPAAALYVLLAVYRTFPLRFGDWQRLFERMGQDVYEASRLMYANPIPYNPHPGLFVLLVPIIVLVVTFATSATLYEESPMVSVAVLGLTIGVLGTVSFEVGIGPFFALFLASGVVLLLLTGDGTRRGERLRPTAALAGALVVFLVLALPNLPIAEEAIQPAAVDWTRLGTGGNSRLAVQADVGSYLTEGRDAELLRINSPEPLLWRGGTLDYFDGIRWSSTVKPGQEYGEEISESVPTYDVVQRVEVLQAETNLLFGAYDIVSVSERNASERSDGSWASSRPFAEGSTYRVLSQVPQPTEAQLEFAGNAYPADVQEKYLQLPQDRPQILRDTSQQILADYTPQTPYEAARDIERFLIYDGGFTYNINASYTRADKAIPEFLGGNKEGFCTHFATTMALLLREQGIPSRVVYGATSGDEVEPGEYVVTGYDMHNWVEVYFPGVGWYPFDPTPGFGVPYAMEANAPRPDIPIPEYNPSAEDPAPRQQADTQPAPEPKETPKDDSASPGEEQAPVWAWAEYVGLPVLILALLVAAVPLTKRMLASRGQPDDLYRDLVGRLRDVLPPGGAGTTVADSPALTPTERLLLLAGAVGVEAGPFREFAQAYSESLYAPDPRPNVARAYRKALREYEGLPRWKRTFGAVNPASLLLRARRSLGAFGARLGKAVRRRREKR